MGRPKKIQTEIQVEPILNNSSPSIGSEPNPLFDLVKTLADNVQKLSEEVKEIKEKNSRSLIQVSGGNGLNPVPMPAQPLMSNFVTQVPTDLLQEAQKILGDKFNFQCVAAPDMPQFTFSVIVPAEYSPYRGAQEDVRSRVIQNSAGINGVKEWCKLVRQNVIKFLGKELPLNV